MRARRLALPRSRFTRALLAVTLLSAAAAATQASSAASAPRAAPAAAVPCAPDTVRQTINGPVCGVVVNNDAEWLGIPYASPPIGDLRWAPPQPPAPWTSPLQATAFGSSCAQSFFSASGSEDCLFVNVTRPADGAGGLPVLVHIHGGGFVAGSGNGNYSLLADTGHEVVVSLNYRLGILGFLTNPAFGPHSGDWGLQDQQAALRWVQQNIAQFGGDPHNVTIYGESAGGSSVCDAIASPTARGLFERGISVSGEYNTLLGSPTSLESQDCKSNLPTQTQADAAGRDYATSVGCTDPAAVAACLRSLTVEQVEATVGFGYQDGGHGTVGPTINGTTLTLSLRQALRRGEVNHVTVIAGVDRDENLVGNATTADQYTQLINTQYGPYASQVLARYPLNHFGSPAIDLRLRDRRQRHSAICGSERVGFGCGRVPCRCVVPLTSDDSTGCEPAGTPERRGRVSHSVREERQPGSIRYAGVAALRRVARQPGDVAATSGRQRTRHDQPTRRSAQLRLLGQARATTVSHTRCEVAVRAPRAGSPQVVCSRSRRLSFRSIWLMRRLSWVISSRRAALPALVRLTQVRARLPS